MNHHPLAVLFAGKRLLRSESPLPGHVFNELVRLQLLKAIPCLQAKGSHYLCGRCGNEDLSLFGSHPCARCKATTCTYCRNCIQLGKMSSCQFLYEWQGELPPFPFVKKSLHWQGQLSSGQKRAADAVVEAVKMPKEVLIWAVCGAGKTEIMFHGLEEAFKRGFRVLLATPRTDVVKELYPRLQKSFPHIIITALYGGSKDRHSFAQLIVATTHQAMRFYEAFDVVIVDEVDAFPFSYDKSLQFAVEHAKKQTASTIYLSATPSTVLRKTPNLEVVKIPKRFHGHPLPVPQLTWIGNWQKQVKKNTLPRKLLIWFETMISSKKTVLLFVPSVSYLSTISSLLKANSIPHKTVHANDPNRHEAVASFRKQLFPVMVTTTILERGVTFPNVQVAVLGAENDVFTESALVQIAGRVGRSATHASGDVVFFHYGTTIAMKSARRHILQMNEEGRGL